MAVNKLGSAWASMKTIAGLQSTERNHVLLDGFNTQLANALNCFYCRFDSFDFSTEAQEWKHKLKDDLHLNIELQDVKKAIRDVQSEWVWVSITYVGA